MKFLSIRAENFLSFPEFDYILPQVGLYFIGGRILDGTMSISNGAGKSALFESLAWGLFGKTIRHMGRAEDRDKVIRRAVGKNCFVEIIIEDDDGVLCIVRRYRKHDEWQNSLRLYKGEDEITGPSVDETQKIIDSIIGMNWVVFSSAVIFGDKAKRFNDAAESKKKEVFDEILMLHPYQIAQKLVKTDLKELMDDIDQSTWNLSSEIANLIDYDDELEAVKKDANVIARDKENAQAEISERNKLLKINLELFIVLKESKIKADKEWGVIVAQADALNEIMSGSRQKETIEIDSLRKATFVAQKNLMPVEANYEKINEWLLNKEELPKGERCPTCRTIISEQSIDDVTKHYKLEMLTLKPKLLDFDDMLQKALTAEKDTNKKWTIVKQETDKEYAILSKKMSDHEAGIHEIERKMHECKSAIAIIENEINNLKTGTKIREDLVIQIKKRAEAKIAGCKEKVKSFEEQIKIGEEQVKYYKFWVDGFSGKGIKSLLLDEVLPQLNTLADYYGSVLLDNEIKMEFDTESELKSGVITDKFNIRLVSGKDIIDYRDCSQGERGRIDSAVLLALQNLIFRRSACASSLVIFDEVFEHLDSVGIERMVNLLKEEANNKAIFVISHQNEFSDYFDNVVMIERENGESRIGV